MRGTSIPPFEPDISKIADAIGAARTAVMRGYNEYVGTKEKPVPSLSSVCKEKRDAAILEQHKAGTSDYAIAKLFGMNAMTVGRVLSEMVDSNKNRNPVNVTTAAPSVLPLANTDDRSDTRLDADELVDDFLESYSDYIPLAEVGKPHSARLHNRHRSVSCR